MPAFNPELIGRMRSVLEEVVSQIPTDQITPGMKAYLAESILKAAARGETSYEGLIAIASSQVHAIMSTLG